MRNAKKITSILMVAAISLGMFAGCSSKTTTATATTATTATASTTTNTKGNNSAAMKTVYSNVLKALVTAKTITQAQSDKVLVAATKAMPTGGQRTRGAAPANGEKPSGSTQTKGEKPSGTARTGGGNHKNDRLSALVTSKVITQAQADAINKDVQAAMKTSQAN